MYLNINTLVIYITYNPDLFLFNKSIDKTLSFFSNVLIIDNNSINKFKFTNYENRIRKIIFNDSNIGLSKALNKAFDYAKINNFKFVLVLDQDSIIPDNLFFEYQKTLNDNTKVIITPMVIDRLTNTFQHNTNKVTRKFPINSGSLISLLTWELIGKFDENLFIDGIDHDFFIRARIKGVKILKLSNVYLSHQIGIGRVFNFFKIKFIIFNHNSFRKYHIAFSTIYIAKKHKNSFFSVIISILRIQKQILKVLFFESNKFDKILSIMRGLKDGFNSSLNVNL